MANLEGAFSFSIALEVFSAGHYIIIIISQEKKTAYIDSLVLCFIFQCNSYYAHQNAYTVFRFNAFRHLIGVI